MIIREYVAINKRNYFGEWYEVLAASIRERIAIRLYRAKCGNLGDYKAVGHGVFELRIHISPGYRIYFGFYMNEIIVLLAGGDKGSQRRDVIRARQLWIEARMRRRNEKSNS